MHMIPYMTLKKTHTCVCVFVCVCVCVRARARACVCVNTHIFLQTELGGWRLDSHSLNHYTKLHRRNWEDKAKHVVEGLTHIHLEDHAPEDHQDCVQEVIDL